MSRARTLANYVSSGVTAAEFDYMDGVTSAVQTQIDAKAPTTGHASIATVGTVTSGTWQGTTVAVNQGGTGAATHTANNVMIGAGTSALTSIAPGADGEVLTSTGSVWQSEAAGGGGDAGSSAFLMGKSGGWVTVATGSVVAFDNTTGHGFNTGSDFGSVESNAYTTPAAGVYLFGFHMYSNQSGAGSTWTFAINDTDLVIIGGLSYGTPLTGAIILDSSVCLSLGSGDEVDVRSELNGSTFYGALSYFWGCRIS